MEVQDALAGWSKLDDGTRDALIILAALIVVTALAMGWAFFVRRKKREGYHQHQHRHHHRHRHHRHRDDDSSESDEQETVQAEEDPEQRSSASHHRRRKWRRRRREHRPRNPTLAETGGLPPIREGPPNTGP